LPEPIFTPATKAESGHDENVSFGRACEIAGAETMERLRSLSIALYRRAADFAASRGVILADTKFEFGRVGDELILIDEALTPDSSRYWPAADYAPGRDQQSFDKQFVRNYLQQLCDRGEWDKTDPAPALPEEIELLKKIAEFPEVVARAGEAREPHHIAYYARDLAGLWNPYVQDGVRHRVVSDDASLTGARLGLARAVRTVLANALNLLGVSAPEQM